MAPHSSTLAWKIPWTEEPGRLQSMGSLLVRAEDWPCDSILANKMGELKASWERRFVAFLQEVLATSPL